MWDLKDSLLFIWSHSQKGEDGGPLEIVSTYLQSTVATFVPNSRFLVHLRVVKWKVIISFKRCMNFASQVK